jgi:hypothetical protein
MEQKVLLRKREVLAVALVVSFILALNYKAAQKAESKSMRKIASVSSSDS